jgi:hypothetical protein
MDSRARKMKKQTEKTYEGGTIMDSNLAENFGNILMLKKFSICNDKKFVFSVKKRLPFNLVSSSEACSFSNPTCFNS